VDHSEDVALEHDQIDHFPSIGILQADGQSGGVREASNQIGPPMIGFGGAPKGERAGPPAGDAGVPAAYHSVVEERFSSLTVPRPPADVSAEAEDGFAYVTWIPSCLDGGSPVMAYTVSSSLGAKTTISSEEFQAKGYVVLQGLGNGRAVAFMVSASNALGASPYSLPTANVTPNHKRKLKPPLAPAAVSVTTGKSGTRVQITPPAADGGSPVVAYSVTSPPSEIPVVIEGLDVIHPDPAHPVSRDLGNLSPGRGSTVSVAATSAAGEGQPAVVKLKP
jgi:hypothetical protein